MIRIWLLYSSCRFCRQGFLQSLSLSLRLKDSLRFGGDGLVVFPLQLSPSVLWYCWLGLLTCKNRLPYNLYCVGGDVKKHCSIQSNGLVVSALDQRPRGRGFESAGCGLSCSNRGPDALCTLGLGLLNPPSSRVGKWVPATAGKVLYKAGTCDAAWCAPCTWAPLWWPCLLWALYQVLDLYPFHLLRTKGSPCPWVK